MPTPGTGGTSVATHGTPTPTAAPELAETGTGTELGTALPTALLAIAAGVALLLLRRRLDA